MALARKIAYNIIASSASKIFSTFLALIAIGFVTRYLGKDGFGNYATVLAFLSFFSAISDLGLNPISTREISRSGADENKIIGNIFCLRIISSFIIIALSPIIINFFNYPKEVERGILIIAVSFLFSSSYQVLNGIFQKNLAMDKVALGEFFGKVIQVTAVIIAVKFNLGFDWIIGSLLIAMIVNFLIIFLWSRKYLKFSMQFDFLYWKKFLKQSLPIGISAIITFIYFKMDTILLSVMKTNADVGIYNAAYKVLENITFFPAMIAGLVLPIMSHSIFTDRKKFEEISNKTFKFFIILTVPLIVGTLFLSEKIIAIIGGAEFSASAPILRILVFALAFIFFGHFFNTILIVGNAQKKLMYVLAIVAVFNVILNLFLIPRFSYFAAASVSVFTEMLVVAFTMYLTIKIVKYFPKMEKLFGIFVSGIFMAVFLFFFGNSNFLISSIGSVAVYLIALWLFKTVTAQEILSIINKKGIQNYEGLS